MGLECEFLEKTRKEMLVEKVTRELAGGDGNGER